MIPKPPKKKEISFPDPDFHQQKKDFHKQIREIIFGFYSVIPRSKNRDLLLEFADNIIPGKEPDVTRLPYVGRGSNATSENKITCVFALISCLVRMYWKFYNGAKNQHNIAARISFLNIVLKNGLDKYQVKGNLAEGYYLKND